MIDHLRGRLSGGGKDFVVVGCAGVGFRVQVSSLAGADLPPEGESCYLRTFLHMREGGVDLFGFSSETEREIFLAIIGVSGVGAKAAGALPSVMGIAGGPFPGAGGGAGRRCIPAQGGRGGRTRGSPDPGGAETTLGTAPVIEQRFLQGG